MRLDASFLEALSETRRYPALLARLAGVEPGGVNAQLDISALLLDVLGEALPVEAPAALFSRLLEKGEIAAAEKLHQLGELGRSERARIVSRSSALQQDLQQVKRKVMGLMLLLKDASDPELRGTIRRIEALCEDERLCKGRPGWVIGELQREEGDLERTIADMLQQIRHETEALRARLKDAHNRDLLLALERISQLSQSQENLPAAQRMLLLAGRAADGSLNREDLKSLHQSGPHQQRLVRPWADFDEDGLEHAAAIARVLRAQSDIIELPSDFDRNLAVELFDTLSLQGGRLNTGPAAAKLLEFLNLEFPLKETARSGVGSAFAFEFAAPRVPAFRHTSVSGGIQLVIPHVANPSAVAKLCKQLPENSFPIIYFPGKLRTSLADRCRSSDELAYFDNLDLLRLCEVPHGQRETAFQQVILPRAPFSQVKPWQIGGPVSPEMFRGRQTIIDKLKSPKGGTILFSGRMMGKSSILERIYREIEEDSRRPKERAVKVSNASVDLFRSLVDKLAGLLPDKDARRARRKIDGLQLSTSLAPGLRNERSKQRLDLIRKIVTQFLRTPEARLTILIDEADHFAAQDAQTSREHSIAWLLRDLEFDDPERVRVVFAGFQTIHNQVIAENGAFANWYGLQQLSTLEDSDARALIVEPFADFAFAFASQAGVERILEFTGRHPLLIQEVCSRLMERMHARRTVHAVDEVIIIEAGDVEVVCRDDQLRDRLHQILSLNLNEYRRLKLMVYLILDSCGSGSDVTLRLEDFSLASLKAELLKWYGAQFNEYFDEKNIGALVSRLKALGLVKSHGDTYQFVNRTYARMLMESPAFEQELEALLAFVTDPVKGKQRRFVALPNEHLERIVHNRGHQGTLNGNQRQNMLFIGLPGTGQDNIAAQLFGRQQDGPRGSYRISGRGCTHISGVREKLKQELGERRRTLSLADFVVKNEVDTLVITDADELAAAGQLSGIAQSLNQRDRCLFAFGGAELAREYVRTLCAENFDTVCLERLRPQDIKSWGNERLQAERGHIIMFDDSTARGVRRVTGGYLPLIMQFADFVRASHQTAKEYFPSPQDVEKFFENLDLSAVEAALLGPLDAAERAVLAAVYHFARAEKVWQFNSDWVEELLLPRLQERTSLGSKQLRDILDVLHLLDLVSYSEIDGARSMVLSPTGPLAKLLTREAHL